mgnify:FL=1
MSGLFVELVRIGFPIFFGLILSAFLAYWLSVKIQGFIYRHTGRTFLSFLYGLPSLVGLFFFFSIISWSIGVGIMEATVGRGSVEVFIMGGGFLALPLTALILLSICTLLAGKASSLKNIPTPKISGTRLFFYAVPVLIPILVSAMLVFVSFA